MTAVDVTLSGLGFPFGPADDDDDRHVEDPQRMRKVDVPLTVGSPERLRAATGWQPRYSLIASLRDIYESALQKEEE